MDDITFIDDWYRDPQIVTIITRSLYFYNTYDYEFSFKVQKNFQISIFDTS